MTLGFLKPPPVLDGARVLQYAVLDDSVDYCGHSVLFVDGRELGRVPCLAICQAPDDTSVLLFHCSDDWRVLGTAEYSSLSKAGESAERIYPGLSKRWIETHVTEQQAAQYLEQFLRDQGCSFCGKRPDQIDRVVEKNKVRICNFCVSDFYQALRED